MRSAAQPLSIMHQEHEKVHTFLGPRHEGERRREKGREGIYFSMGFGYVREYALISVVRSTLHMYVMVGDTEVHEQNPKPALFHSF